MGISATGHRCRQRSCALTFEARINQNTTAVSRVDQGAQRNELPAPGGAEAETPGRAGQAGAAQQDQPGEAKTAFEAKIKPPGTPHPESARTCKDAFRFVPDGPDGLADLAGQVVVQKKFRAIVDKLCQTLGCKNHAIHVGRARVGGSDHLQYM